jgi:hypothetical protein
LALRIPEAPKKQLFGVLLLWRLCCLTPTFDFLHRTLDREVALDHLTAIGDGGASAECGLLFYIYQCRAYAPVRRANGRTCREDDDDGQFGVDVEDTRTRRQRVGQKVKGLEYVLLHIQRVAGNNVVKAIQSRV